MMHSFFHRKDFYSAAAQDIFSEIAKACSTSSEARILLSGGSTPGPVYELLNHQISANKKLTIGLVDERFVPTTSEFSNEKMIREKFSNCHGEIKGMVLNDQNYAENIELVEKSYDCFKNRTDLVVLGMGGDGHTASFFPEDLSSITAMEMKDFGLCNTSAPTFPNQRITCNLKLLASSKKVYLLLTGADKIEILENVSLDLPIHRFLAARPDTIIYYCEQ